MIHDRFVEALLDEIPVRFVVLLMEGDAQRPDHLLFDIRG